MRRRRTSSLLLVAVLLEGDLHDNSCHCNPACKHVCRLCPPVHLPHSRGRSYGLRPAANDASPADSLGERLFRGPPSSGARSSSNLDTIFARLTSDQVHWNAENGFARKRIQGLGRHAWN